MFFVEYRRKDAADQDKTSDDDRQGPGACHEIRKDRLIVHNRKEPGRYHPDRLGEKIGERLQPRPLMIIGSHFITQRDPGDRITGKGNDKKTLDHQHILKIEIFAMPLIQLKHQS